MAVNTSSALFASFSAAAPEGQQVVLSRILVPAMESARLTVLSAEYSEPELKKYKERQYYACNLDVKFNVDEAEAREVTGQDTPLLFHRVRVNFINGTTDFDWGNNIDLLSFFTTLGVSVYEGTGKTRNYVGHPMGWAADAVGRSLLGKIVHEPTKAQDEITGEWTSFKLDLEGEVVMKTKLAAISKE